MPGKQQKMTLASQLLLQKEHVASERTVPANNARSLSRRRCAVAAQMCSRGADVQSRRRCAVTAQMQSHGADGGIVGTCKNCRIDPASTRRGGVPVLPGRLASNGFSSQKLIWSSMSR